MELAAWYLILAAAVLVIAVMIRFIIYSVLVGHQRWLPEKAAGMANRFSGAVLGIGMLTLIFRVFIGSR